MPRKQKKLELMEGHLTQDQKIEKEQKEAAVEAPSEKLKGRAPKWLRDTVAVEEWKRLKKMLLEIGIINDLDYNNLGAYCNAFSFYIQATKELEDEELLKEYTNKSGATNEIRNPRIDLQIKYAEEMRKFAALLGLTVDSRLKIAGLTVQKQQDKITDEFGDI